MLVQICLACMLFFFFLGNEREPLTYLCVLKHLEYFLLLLTALFIYFHLWVCQSKLFIYVAFLSLEFTWYYGILNSFWSLPLAQRHQHQAWHLHHPLHLMHHRASRPSLPLQIHLVRVLLTSRESWRLALLLFFVFFLSVTSFLCTRAPPAERDTWLWGREKGRWCWVLRHLSLDSIVTVKNNNYFVSWFLWSLEFKCDVRRMINFRCPVAQNMLRNPTWRLGNYSFPACIHWFASS